MIVNLKKAAVAVLALGVTSLATAGMYAPPSVENQEPTLKNGFYAGIGIGGIGFSSQQSGQGSAEVAFDRASVSGSGSGSDSDGSIGLNSTLLAGYAWHLPKKIFLGTEVFGTLTNTPVSTSTDLSAAVAVDNLVGVNVEDSYSVVDGTVATTSHLTLQSSYGIRALPGYQVSSNAVIYGIVGWVSAQAKGTSSGSATINSDFFAPANLSLPEPQTINIEDSNTEHYNFYGYQLGLGSMINLTEHVAVRGDLIYSNYNSQTISSGSAEVSGEYVYQGSVSADPSSLEANVALVYMFD